MIFNRVLIFYFVFLQSAAAFAQSSFDYYSEGKYAEVVKALPNEYQQELEDQHAFLSSLRLAKESFIQDPKITLEQLNAVYDAAFKQSSKFYMEKRIVAEKTALNQLLLKEDSYTLQQAITEFKKIQSFGKSKENKLEKSTRLFALTVLLRRKANRYPDQPEWKYWIGKCYELDSNDPTVFFEEYLRHRHTENLEHARDAYVIVERQYRLDFKGQVPLEIEADLKELKAKVNVLEGKNKKKK